MIPYLPSDVATDFGQLQQRLAENTEQEQQLQEKARMLHERQVALQLAHEMEQRLRDNRVKYQQEQDAKARQAEGFLVRAKQLTQRGAFDEALQMVAEAQALKPPQASRVESARNEILAAKKAKLQQTVSTGIEQAFSQAMQAFQQERYEEAINLFEQVVSQEASLNDDAPEVAPGPPPQRLAP